MLKDHHALVVDEVIRGRSDVGYRWSSKRVARSRDGRLVLGSFRRGSHRVADMEECLVDHPDIASAARHISGVASYLGIEAWDERTGEGDLRYVCFKTNGRGDVLVTLISGTDRSRMPELAAELEGFAGIAWSVQADTGNAIRGGDARLLRGVPSIEVELAEQRVAVGPLGFLQPNPEVASLAYRELCDVPASELVFDLYAGAGVTTALLSRRAQKVLTCESNPESAAGLGARAETVEVFLARGLEEGLAPRVVVANPPRSGMGPEVCRALKAFARRGLQELRLMSCGPAGLRRDLDDLSPAFELVSLRAYDTLPHTPHVELVAKLHAVPGSE